MKMGSQQPRGTECARTQGLDSSRPRVVRVIARLNVGGPARHVAWLTAGLAGEGFESLLVAGRLPEGEQDLSGFVRAQGVEPITIAQLSREISWRDLLVIGKLYRTFVRLQPDIIHTHTAKAGTVGRLAGLLYRWCHRSVLWRGPRRCRIVHTFHGHVFHSYFGRGTTRLFLAMERWLARLATDRIVVISPRQLTEIHHVFGIGRAEQFVTVPLGLDLEPYTDWPHRRHCLRCELGADPEDLLVGIVGRLTEVKNHELFLQVAARYRSRHSGSGRVRFVIVGDGHLRGLLEYQTRVLGLEEEVVFLGNRSDPTVFYPGLDIVVLTSRNEGTPLTILEAMANARPVVATAVGGVPDLLGDPVENSDAVPGMALCQRGILVAPDAPAALCEALGTLASDAALRDSLGQRGAQYVRERHSRERLVADIARVYRELLEVESTQRDSSCELANVSEVRSTSGTPVEHASCEF